MDLKITKIEIQNFRSVKNLILRPEKLAVIVGRNDSGKSNVLRALNLFFNGETNPNEYLDFETDHNTFNNPSKRAKEIVVRLTLSLPQSYVATNGEYVVWEKCWRSDSEDPRSEEYFGQRIRSTRSGSTTFEKVEIPDKSRLHTLLRHINYVYVPAIKDMKYFAQLRASIYGTVADVAARTFHDSSQTFERSISKHLEELTEEITATLGFESRLALPHDLSHVFESLDFLSAGSDISLNSRGDGIKVRHIPMILKFMADKKHELKGPGVVPYAFFWGYEEPENNLELASCVELADQFIKYANDGVSQIFLTTHSPIFYNLRQQNPEERTEITCHHMMLDNFENGTEEITNPSDLDERMGTMTMFAPMVEEIETRIRLQEAARRSAEQLAEAGRRKLFVEGPTDQIVVKKCIKVFADDLVDKLDVETLEDSGGWNYVVDMLSGWRNTSKHKRGAQKAAGIVDGDEDARRAKNEWNKVNANILSAKCFMLPMPPHLYAAYNLGFKVPLDLEALYDIKAWNWAEERNCLESRDRLADVVPGQLNQEILNGNITLDECLEEEWAIYVRKKFLQGGKMRVAKYYSEMKKEEFAERMNFMEKLVEEIREYLF